MGQFLDPIEMIKFNMPLTCNGSSKLKINGEFETNEIIFPQGFVEYLQR